MASRARGRVDAVPSGWRNTSSQPSGPRYFAEDFFSASPVLTVARPKPIKKVDFAAQPHIVFVVESGADEFTIGNRWPDGSSKASFHKERLFSPRRRSRRKRRHPVEAEVLAHARALDLMLGKEFPLPEARLSFHDGRRP